MGLFDELQDMAGKAEKVAAEHPDQVKGALSKIEGVVDEKTGGTHHDQIVAAGEKAQEFIEKPSQPSS